MLRLAAGKVAPLEGAESGGGLAATSVRLSGAMLDGFDAMWGRCIAHAEEYDMKLVLVSISAAYLGSCGMECTRRTAFPTPTTPGVPSNAETAHGPSVGFDPASVGGVGSVAS